MGRCIPALLAPRTTRAASSGSGEVPRRLLYGSCYASRHLLRLRDGTRWCAGSIMPRSDSSSRHQWVRPAPPGVNPDIWLSLAARYRALAGPALDHIELHGPCNSEALAHALHPGLNAGRMGEVMKILRRKGFVDKDENRFWSRTSKTNRSSMHFPFR